MKINFLIKGYPTSEMQLSGDKQIEIITGKELELCRKACEVSFANIKKKKKKINMLNILHNGGYILLIIYY